MSQPTPQIAAKVQKLARIIPALRSGEHFQITRLTTVKSLCQTPYDAACFVLHIARLTHRRMKSHQRPPHVTEEEWRHYKTLVARAVRCMSLHTAQPSRANPTRLHAIWSALRQEQNEYKYIEWGPVRLIKSNEVLLVEYAVECMRSPHAAAYWAYQVARHYAERYNPRYGTGLIPESDDTVEDIADFWCRHYFKVSLKRWPNKKEIGKTPAMKE